MSWHERSPRFWAALLLFPVLLAASGVQAEPVTLRRTVELALQHHGLLTLAAIDEQKASLAIREAHDAYLPTVVFGSGLGYSYGVPLSVEGSVPSIFNVNTQQYIFNLPQHYRIKALEAERVAAQMNTAEQRDEVVLEASLAYLDLSSAEQELKALVTESELAERTVFIAKEREKAGLDSTLDRKRAELSAARCFLRRQQVETSLALQREKLASMTGLDPQTIESDAASIPALPVEFAGASESLTVRLARQKAAAAELRVQAEAHGSWPSIDLASQYAVLSKYNNYDEYYKKFSRNNLSVGLSIRFPIFDFAQRARTAAAREDAVKAHKDVELTKTKVGEERQKLQASLRQLSASEDVARLEYEIATGEAEAVEARMTGGEANLRELTQAKFEATEKLAAWHQSQHDNQRARLQLLRAEGSILQWAEK